MDVRDRLASWPVVVADVGLGVVFALALVTQAVAFADSWGGGYWIFDAVAGLSGCGLALVRRRHRAVTTAAGLLVGAASLGVAGAAGLPAEPGLALTLALAVLVGSALRTLPPVPAGTAVLANLGLVVATWLVFPSSAGVGAVTVLNGLGLSAAVSTGLVLRLLDVRRATTTERVRRDERLALARELHDVVAHHVTGIVLQAQAAQLATRRPTGGPGTPAGLAEALAGIETAGSAALGAMRRVVGVLRDVDDAPSATAAPEHLDELVTRFAGPGRPVVRLHHPEGPTGWPPEVTSTVYRVVQESLTNVSRHAPHARTVTVRVDEQRRGVTVEVVDDAPPLPGRRSPDRGYGLVGMRERVETLGGTLRVGPRPGAGWAVHATLPVPAPERR
ncbi:histidine kinase [Plantactinospora sp. B5E13]|uniref:sensor histidine kinase n=1 Tax=Plantactinospora sp. B5E13 TaxID=3153758 RepID=UPI00325D0675